ncbi:MAG: hypothetical protein ABIN79_10825 [Marmoricola sp.]
MDQPSVDETTWPTDCPECGTRLQHSVIDFDPTNDTRAEFNAGEMAAIDFCPNPDCPAKAAR